MLLATISSRTVLFAKRGVFISHDACKISHSVMWDIYCNQDMFLLTCKDILIVLKYDANSTSKWIYCYDLAESLEIAFTFKTLFQELPGYR